MDETRELDGRRAWCARGYSPCRLARGRQQESDLAGVFRPVVVDQRGPGFLVMPGVG